MGYPKIDIIIVNWNAGKTLCDCLESIYISKRNNFILNRVVVVDNASTDGSVDRIEGFELPLTVIRNTENLGFAVACNQGAKGSIADYLLFLNPDTRLFENSLEKPLDFMERPDSQDIGIIGVQLIGDDEKVGRTCSRFPTPSRIFLSMLGLKHRFRMLEWSHDESRDVDIVMGAFFLVRGFLFEALGGFDERFFVYFEEVDFAYRAKKAGWRSFYLAKAQAYHKGGGTSNQVKSKRLFYSLSSRILYCYKHFSWWAATTLTLGTLFIEPFARLMLGVINRSSKEVSDTIKGYFMLWRAVPRLRKVA